MLRPVAPRKETNERIFIDLSELPKAQTTTFPESPKPIQSAPLPKTAQLAQPRPAIRSSLAVGGTVYPGWSEPHLTKTPWELERNKKRATWRRSKAIEVQFPAEVFKCLPKDVYECIVAQLEQIHLGEDEACPTCYIRDLHNLSLVSRAWVKSTTYRMYHKVLLPARAEHAKLPKLRIRGTGRLKLLRRTLRERTSLARCVREVHMSDFQTLYHNATIDKEEIANLVASIVMACPYLERLVGFHMSFSHSFDRLSHTLSTRTNLKEKVWLLSGQNAEMSDDEDNDSRVYYLAACDPTERFLELNSNHPMLSTFVLHQDYSHNLPKLNFRAIVGTLRQFPVLRHLSISGLSSSSFTNLTLNALPSNLHSLRLENLSGINDTGIQRFATSRLATDIKTLILINLGISNLSTLSNILCGHFADLQYFAIVQQKAPGLSSSNAVSQLSSPKLQRIHWEFLSEAGPTPTLPSLSTLDITEKPSFPFANQEPISCLATTMLAAGIREGAFPSLRRVRIPHDPQGLIQALCKPLGTALLPADMAAIRIKNAKNISLHHENHEALQTKARDSVIGSLASRRADSAINSPISCNGFHQSTLTPARSRLAAQSRILAARREALVTFRVYDPHGNLKIDKGVGGFIGQLGSQITYELIPDRARTFGGTNDETIERNEWITNIEDLASESESESFELRSNCGHWTGAKLGCKTVMVADLF